MKRNFNFIVFLNFNLLAAIQFKVMMNIFLEFLFFLICKKYDKIKILIILLKIYKLNFWAYSTILNHPLFALQICF